MIHVFLAATLLAAAPKALNEPPAVVRVKPVFVVPRGEPLPTDEQVQKLAEHLDWARRSFRLMLKDRDTFTLAEGKPVVHRSVKPIKDYEKSAQHVGPLITSELFAAGRFNRFNCPYVFVAVVMDGNEGFPTDVAQPFNGGFGFGGGIAIFSSHQLDTLPHFQTALQHGLGHAFGLPHVSAYQDSMETSDSIMSDNHALRTNGMKPGPMVGVLGPHERRALSFNQHVFPKLTVQPVRTGSAVELKPFDPMPIDGQPPYAFEVTTDSGETWGTKVANLARRKRIRINEGGRFDPDSMWQSRESADGWSTVIVTFPVPVTLTGIGVHSQHSGASNAANGLVVEVPSRGGTERVAESPLSTTDAIVPLLAPTTSKAWRLSFHAENKRSVTIRGLRFFTRNGEIFGPQVPYEP